MSKALILLAPGFEEIEAVAVMDILRRAGVDVVSAGIQPGVITSSHGIKLIPDIHIEMVQPNNYDMLILPGGMPGTTNLGNDNRVKELIANFHNSGKYLAAICAAPSVFSDVGILSDKNATSYPSIQPQLKAKQVISDQKVVRDGNVITSQGPGTAFDFGFALAAILVGDEQAQQIRTAMLYT